MLDVAEIPQGTNGHRKEVDLRGQIVAQAFDLVAPMLEERRHHLEIDIQPPALIVLGDERRLVQALTNLLTNAVKYTEPGGSIRVSVTSDGEDISLGVRDTGRGISADFLPQVFDLFVEGERTPDRREGGLGLGLPIVRSIVERHGGTVSAVSGGLGTGSEFVIRLPASGANTPLPAAAPSMAALAPRDRKVLIIDDNEDAAESLSAFLEESGLSCASALDGPSGLDAVASFAPDTILIHSDSPALTDTKSRDEFGIARRRQVSRHCDHRLWTAGIGCDWPKRASTRIWSSRSTSISSSLSCTPWTAWGQPRAFRGPTTCARRDSNSLPPAPEAGALSNGSYAPFESAAA